MVRLTPHREDGYIWIRRPEREHLFTKQLSKHSIGAYTELCREVGISFEAIATPQLRDEASEDGTRVRVLVSSLPVY